MADAMQCITLSPAIAILLLLVAAAGTAQAQYTPAYDTSYQLHGSGTSNPAQLVWKVMDMMVARTKPQIAMSYRSIGSGNGQRDFFNNGGLPKTAFGCGDVPMTLAGAFENMSASGQPMVHVPYLVGSVSFFHNVPGVGKGATGMFLHPCTLARIFKGDITRWNDPAILEDNPGLVDELPDAAIVGVRRETASSSTYAITYYFNRACEAEWDNSASGNAIGVGLTSWRFPTTFRNVSNSQGMVEAIGAAPYTIGYVESGQGLNGGLKEIAILNSHNVSLLSTNASIAPTEFIEAQFRTYIDDPAWVNVNPVYPPASVQPENLWPMTLGTYFYVRRNLTYLGPVGGLLVQFLNTVLSDPVAAMMPDLGFIALPRTTRDNLTSQLTSTLILDPNSEITWKSEPTSVSPNGQDDYTVSDVRNTYLYSSMVAAQSDLKDIKRAVRFGSTYQTHGSGSQVPAKFLRRLMSTMQEQSRVPVAMTYRVVGSAEAAMEFAEYQNMYSSLSHFKVADAPLPTDVYATLNAASVRGDPGYVGAPWQFPISVTPLTVFYNKKVPRGSFILSACNLARIYNSDATRWNDDDISSDNRYPVDAIENMLNQPMVVFSYAVDTAYAKMLSMYLSNACDDEWEKDIVTFINSTNIRTTYGTANTPITTPEQMADALASTPNSIGYLPLSTINANASLTPLLSEAGLENSAGRFVMASASADVQDSILKARIQGNQVKLSSPEEDLDANYDPTWVNGNANNWPVPLVTYVYVYNNLTQYSYGGALMMAMMERIYSAEGRQLMIDSGLVPMPEEVAGAYRNVIKQFVLRPLVEAWSFEATNSFSSIGSELFTFSGNRQSSLLSDIQDLEQTVSDMQATFTQQENIVLRAAGGPESRAVMQLLADQLHAISTPQPLDLMYEDAAISDAATLLSSTPSAPEPRAHFFISPGPLPSSIWSSLSRTTSVVQFPWLIRPIALAYKGAPGLRLTPCLLGRILENRVTSWDDRELRQLNPQLVESDPDFKGSFSLLYEDANDNNLLAAELYAKTCNSGTIRVNTAPPRAPGVPILDQVYGGKRWQYLAITTLAALDAGAYYLPNDYRDSDVTVSTSNNGQVPGLRVAAFPSTAFPQGSTDYSKAMFIGPDEVPSCGGLPSSPQCTANTTAAYRNNVDAIVTGASNLRAALGAPVDPTNDWAGFSLMGGAALNNESYPLFRLDFLVVDTDLRSLGAEGAAIKAAVQYMLTNSKALDTIAASTAPHCAVMGEPARSRLLSPAPTGGFPARDPGSILSVAAEARPWAIVASSKEIEEGATNALVTNRLAAVSLIEAETASDSGAGSLARLGTRNYVTAPQLAAQIDVLLAQVKDAQDKADLAYQIAVAALVLGLILSLLSMCLASSALRRVRNGIPHAKYSDGGSNTVQMSMLP